MELKPAEQVHAAGHGDRRVQQAARVGQRRFVAAAGHDPLVLVLQPEDLPAYPGRGVQHGAMVLSHQARERILEQLVAQATVAAQRAAADQRPPHVQRIAPARVIRRGQGHPVQSMLCELQFDRVDQGAAFVELGEVHLAAHGLHVGEQRVRALEREEFGTLDVHVQQVEGRGCKPGLGQQAVQGLGAHRDLVDDLDLRVQQPVMLERQQRTALVEGGHVERGAARPVADRDLGEVDAGPAAQARLQPGEDGWVGLDHQHPLDAHGRVAFHLLAFVRTDVHHASGPDAPFRQRVEQVGHHAGSPCTVEAARSADAPSRCRPCW